MVLFTSRAAIEPRRMPLVPSMPFVGSDDGVYAIRTAAPSATAALSVSVTLLPDTAREPAVAPVSVKSVTSGATPVFSAVSNSSVSVEPLTVADANSGGLRFTAAWFENGAATAPSELLSGFAAGS